MSEEKRRRLIPRTTPPPPPVVVVGERKKVSHAASVLVAGSEDRWLAQLYSRTDAWCHRFRKILHLVEKKDPQGRGTTTGGPEKALRNAELTVRLVGKVLHALALTVPVALVLLWERIKMTVGSH